MHLIQKFMVFKGWYMGGSRLRLLNAEVTSAVVKLLKNTGIPIFSTKLVYFFLLLIKRLEGVRPRYVMVILQKLLKFNCPLCGKNFPEIFENSVIFKKVFKNPDYTKCLFFKCLQYASNYTGWTEYRACCMAIVLTLHCGNILTIFKQLSILPFLLEDFTARFTCFQFQKKWRVHNLR